MKTYGILLLALLPIWVSAQKYTLSGYVTEAGSGESLIGANLVLSGDKSIGTTTNTYGFYSISLAQGNYELLVSYLGFADERLAIQLDKDIRLNIELRSADLELAEVEVVAKQEDQNVRSTDMGTVELAVENVKKLPALMGEVDILKTLQLLPGVMSAGEGSAGFYVRGGGPDQNLVLLDEAVVYNSGHLLGFFSVFNADAIKNTTLIKGGMPASYGGRLSSVVDIQMKEGNDEHYGVEGGIGAVASRLTIQGPIQKQRSSFILSGRRTYAFDLAQPLIKGTAFEGTNYYFYDLNAKINYRFSDTDRLYLSTYFGRDVLKFRSNTRDFFFDLPYGNSTATLRWNHLFSDKLFMNVSGIYNDYDFGLNGGQADFKLEVFSGVRDWNGRVDFDFFPSAFHKVKFGVNYTYHKLTPNVANVSNGEQAFSNNLQSKYAHEGAAYVQDEWSLSKRLSLNMGLRYSIFTQVGPYLSPIDSSFYTSGEPVKTYSGLEPRFSLNWNASPTASFKIGVTKTYQYLHLVSNSTSTLPADVWVPSSEVVRPQVGWQYATGYFRNFSDNTYETSVEIYYKDLQNQIDYRENYVNNAADELEQEFVFGKGRSYGAEFFLRKQKGKLNGWIGYTLSRTEREFPDINQGLIYPAVYDRRHDLSVVLNYSLSPKWELGTVFVFGTGNAFTPIQSLYFIDQSPVQNYGPRNSARIEDYHRIDFSLTYTPHPERKKAFHSSWNLSVYNVYNRQNPFFIYYYFESDAAAGTAKATAYKVSLFPIIPTITWNFKWQDR
ncbi:MAG TPA: TonB-dependent receptor [Saprospiraceae bacterium]|nr:TonB-dependent receptor [Saprospiraceae bacterium]HMQ81383.1 TonB-dependent receptor [Saprospiraceae bacterium]